MLLRHSNFLILVAAALAADIIPASADAKTDALAAVGQAAAPLIRDAEAYRRHATAHPPTWPPSDETLKQANDCMKAVVVAKQAGATGADVVTFDLPKTGSHDEKVVKWEYTETATGRVYTTNLYEARTYCFEWAQKSSLEALTRHLYRIHKWPKPVADSPATAEAVLADVKKCVELWDAADAYGNKPDTTLELAESKVKLSDVKSICEPLRGPAQKIVDQAQAELDAQMAPFRKALKGDKLEVWEETFGLDAAATGPGGTTIGTPKEFAKASVWFSGARGDDANCPSGKGWIVHKYKFKGTKLVSTSDKSGCGGEIPSRAYR